MPDLYPTKTTPITLADGKPRELRFTNGSIRRLKQKLGCERNADLFSKDFSDVAAEMIFEGLTEKDGVTPEIIDDLMPLAEMFEIQCLVFAAISGKPVDDVKKKLQKALGMEEDPEPEQTTDPS